MSVHIHAYTIFSKEETDKRNRELRLEFPQYFSSNFIIYDADDLEGYAKKIAIEDMNIPSLYIADFLISLNNKEKVCAIANVVFLIKEKFDSENIILLLNGEVEI